MNIDYTGRHVDITPALRQFTEEKMQKLDRLLDGPLEVHVVLGIEKHRHFAEVQVKGRTAVLSAATETGDLYASIGEAVDKLERQAQKHKEKLHDHKHRRGPRDPAIAATIGANAAPVTDEAATAEDEPRGRVVRSRSFRVKPMSVEDAVLEMESSNDDLLVYRDAESDHFCVLYRQKNGDLQLVEPES